MMKRILLFCFTTCLSLSLFAQVPANDDCSGIIDLGFGPSCDSTIYSNVDATASEIFDPPSTDNIPSCWDNVNNDVWFEFTVPADGSIVDFTLTIGGIDDNGNTMNQPQVAIYRGECLTNELDELLCAKADVGETSVEIDLLGLTPGIPYFLRVDAFSASATPNWGDFIVCVDSLQQVNTIDQGGSTSCSGELYDSGGPDENYGDGESNVFSICPPAPNNNCITYTLEYYNIEAGAEQINIYNGNSTNAPLLASISGNSFDTNTEGGVCFVTQADQGCITIEFISDGSNNFEGFASNWECSTQPCETLDQLQVDPNVSSIDIEDAVATPQTLVTVDTIICDQGQYGTFVGDGTDLGLSKGLILTSGSIDNAVGPNSTGSVTAVTGSGGDDDLDFLSSLTGGSTSNDACIVELDVFVATDELAFEYIFGSEEYPEFVNSTFNDIFALLISGPDIAGDPGLNNQLNIATIPGTNTQVEINSVNQGLNWQYYRSNANGQSIEYDGLTSDFLGVKKSLTARADVTPCNTYHLKFAVADRGDSSFDSGVFISEIKGGTPDLSVNFASGIDYLIEGCSGTDDELVISLNNPQDDLQSYGVTVSGTATQGVDYILNLPDTVFITPGETELTFPLIPIMDNLPEGTETIIITLSNNFGCGNINLAEITIELQDEPEVVINLGQDSAFVCQNEGITLSVDGASSYFWTPVSVVDPSDPSMPFATPTVDTWVNVIGTVGPCTAEDSIFLQVIDPQVSINPITVTDICEGESVTLQAVNNVGNQGLTWIPNATLPDPNAQIITDTPPVTTTYTATVELEGCPETATFTVNVDPFDFPDLTTTDTTLCQSFSFEAAQPIPGTSTTYIWTPNNILIDDTTVPNPTITADDGTVIYTVVATSVNGYCSETAEVVVTGVPASAPISNPDTIEVCLGETVDLAANTSTAGVGFQWLSNPFDPTLTPATDTNLTVTPTISTTYFTELIVGACTVYDSIFVRVDSLPDMSLEPVPFKDIYCAGDIISLVTPTYEPSDFPAIMHMWDSDTLIFSSLENLNLVLEAYEAATYTRVTTNRACSDISNITIEVVDPILDLLWTDTTICAGETLENIEFAGEANHMWTPTEGITSGAETNTITLEPTQSVDYTVTATISDCPASATASVTVNPTPVINITPDPADPTQVGTAITFTAEGSGFDPDNAQYIWTYNGVEVGNTNPIDITILEVGTEQEAVNLVQVTVINEFGCTGISNNLSIEGTIPDYFAPNAFTPDGDGVNDFFNLAFTGQEEDAPLGPITFSRFSVWNRWGNLVYNNENPTQGWDGTIDGEPAPSDVYVFFIQIELPNGEIRTFPNDNDPDNAKDLTLIR
ncbi:MAG: choice-of-anchor L domain-containing protein [Bacteroidota bacterium]